MLKALPFVVVTGSRGATVQAHVLCCCRRWSEPSSSFVTCLFVYVSTYRGHIVTSTQYGTKNLSRFRTKTNWKPKRENENIIESSNRQLPLRYTGTNTIRGPTYGSGGTQTRTQTRSIIGASHCTGGWSKGLQLFGPIVTLELVYTASQAQWWILFNAARIPPPEDLSLCLSSPPSSTCLAENHTVKF